MVQPTPPATGTFCVTDETGWLEVTADLIRQGRLSEVDAANLAEYLSDMARRDRREVRSRLIVLLAHLLKWEHQPEKRTASWRRSIVSQRRELRSIFESTTLRNHALTIFSDSYSDAREQALIETELYESDFPSESPWSLDEAVADTDLPI